MQCSALIFLKSQWEKFTVGLGTLSETNTRAAYLTTYAEKLNI